MKSKNAPPWYSLSRFKLLGAMFTLVGTIIGAGVLGIPYVIAQSGFWLGIMVIFFVAFLLYIIYLYTGEIVLRTKGKHQLPGYAGIYLGKWGQRGMSVALTLSIYGSLVAYIFAGGESLRSLLGGIIDIPSWAFSIAFFMVLSAIIFFDINTLSESEISVSSLLIIAVLVIFLFSAGHINPSNYTGFDVKNFFLPYGVVLFAFLGFVGIPEASEILGRKKKKLKFAILLGIFVPLVIYLIFAFTIIGMMGANTQELGTIGIEALIGAKGIIIGNLFMLFAISTSFLALGFGLKEYYYFDKKFSNIKSWSIVCIVPFIAYFLVRLWASFTDVLAFSAIIFGGAQAIIVILTALRAQKLGKRKPEYVVPINPVIATVLIGFIVAGMLSLIF
ncbi:MAG: aromatic amino acid transport family protein [Candidatus Woesearchaeota archaeon]